MILEVQIQISAQARQSFDFQKTPGGLNSNIFCENGHEASFYIKNKRRKTNSIFEF